MLQYETSDVLPGSLLSLCLSLPVSFFLPHPKTHSPAILWEGQIWCSAFCANIHAAPTTEVYTGLRLAVSCRWKDCAVIGCCCVSVLFIRAGSHRGQGAHSASLPSGGEERTQQETLFIFICSLWIYVMAEHNTADNYADIHSFIIVSVNICNKILLWQVKYYLCDRPTESRNISYYLFMIHNFTK